MNHDEDTSESDDSFFMMDEDDSEPFTDGPLKGKDVKVNGFRGIACYVVADDGDNKAVVVMVGDDKKHTVDREDCTVIDEDEFCSVCGQMGCTHNG